MKISPPKQASLWDLARFSALASPVKTSAGPEMELASKAIDPVSGLNAFDSFARYDPQLSSWKTSARSLAGESMSWQGAFPRSAMILSGIAWQLVPCMLRIGETESSSSPGDETWSTPTSREWKDGASAAAAAAAVERGSYPTLGRQVLLMKKLWPTPDAGVFNDGQTLEVWEARHAKELLKGYNGNGGGTPLAMAVKMPPKIWPTPRASPNENRQTSPSPSQIAGTHGRSLAAEACESVRKNWPTPEAADATRGSMTHMRGNPTLLGATKMWPTPTSTDSADSARATCARTHEWQSNPGTTLTDAARLSEAGLPVEAVAPELAGTGSLHASWVESLLGFPPGWTEFDLPATAGPRAQKKPSTTGKRPARSKPVPDAKAPSEGSA